MVTEYSGWILDVYADKGKGAVVWFVCEGGRRLRFVQDLAITFYVGGDSREQELLCEHLKKLHLRFEHTKRKHLFQKEIDVVAIPVRNGATQRSLFRKLHGLFPELDYYNADIALPVHYFVTTNTFPLAFSKVWVDGQGQITKILTNDDKWGLKPYFPKLRLMDVEPTSSPLKSLPSSIRVTFDGQIETISTKSPSILVKRFGELIELYDPDIIRTRYGDAWIFPYLFSVAKTYGVPFNPNRDKTRPPLRVEANQFESYGHLVHRDQQTLLFGRLHLDPQNSMAFKDWGLGGTYETARLSNLPIQNAARRSAGGSFVGMQVTASLQKGILIPIRKEQRERFKSATQMLAADNGGVIFKPITGLHANVAEIDFFSMYPNIMTCWNISAETVGKEGADTRTAPGIDAPIDQDEPGIVADVLRPILAKRLAAKELLESRRTEGYNEEYLQTAYEFLKGLGWVSYGYQGFSGNRIGSIEAHEAINAVSRDVILRAKEVAEDAGFEVLHIYVDSLFASVGGHTKAECNHLLEAIKNRTGLKVDLEGILRWIAFLPSKQNETLPVPNCYYGVFEGGKLKCRGIMARRGDTPVYIADVQMEAIERMAKNDDLNELRKLIPNLVQFFKLHYQKILKGEPPLEKLVISQTLSRNPEDFRVVSPAGAAALQLMKEGKKIRAGQNVEFLRVKGVPNSLSWHLVREESAVEIDVDWYAEQLIRAADEVLSPFGIPKDLLVTWLIEDGYYWLPEDYVCHTEHDLPLVEFMPAGRQFTVLPDLIL
jgi:DNA polymerase-2